MAKNRLTRKLAVILHADVVGSTAHVQQDETLAHERIHAVFNRFSEVIKSYGGVTHELRGDALVAEFERASDAVSASIAFQDANSIRNLELGDDLRPILRIGVAMGEVVTADSTVTGEGVVLAQRLEQLAEPGGLCISGAVHETMPQHLPFHQDDLGEQKLKGFDEPVRVYRVRLKDGESLSKSDIRSKKYSTTRVAASAIIIVFLGGIGLLAWNQFAAPDFEPLDPEAMAQPLPAKASIAVLALDDHSTVKDQGYLSDAISEGIITELARFSELFVIARNSSFQYRDKATDIRDIAAELGVHYVLEGSQQKDGNRLRVTVQLIDALAGRHLWVETFDRKLEDLFAVQDEIVRSVAATVGRKITVGPPPTGGLSRLSALHHNLKARQYNRQFTEEGTEKARLENLAAIEADPASPFGYTGLTYVYIRMSDWGLGDIDPEELNRLARESAEKALELDPYYYEAYDARAAAHLQEGELDLAIARYEKAIELNPSSTGTMATFSEALVYAGRATEAIEIMNRAMRLDPHHPGWYYWNLAWALWTNGDCDLALSALLSMAKLPNMARRSLAVIYVCLGRQEEAEATITKFLENKPEYTVSSFRDSYQHRYKDPAGVEPFLDGLRKAGLPE